MNRLSIKIGSHNFARLVSNEFPHIKYLLPIQENKIWLKDEKINIQYINFTSVTLNA